MYKKKYLSTKSRTKKFRTPIVSREQETKRKGATHIAKHEMMNGTCRNHTNFSSSHILVDNHHML